MDGEVTLRLAKLGIAYNDQYKMRFNAFYTVLYAVIFLVCMGLIVRL